MDGLNRKKLSAKTDRNFWWDLLVFLENFTLPSSNLPSSLTRQVLLLCPPIEPESERTKC